MLKELNAEESTEEDQWLSAFWKGEYSQSLIISGGPSGEDYLGFTFICVMSTKLPVISLVEVKL